MGLWNLLELETLATYFMWSVLNKWYCLILICWFLIIVSVCNFDLIFSVSFEQILSSTYFKHDMPTYTWFVVLAILFRSLDENDQFLCLGEKPHICETCNKGFSTSSSLNTHRRIHLGLKPHVCGQCGKCFTASSNLYYHKMTHTKVINYRYCHRYAIIKFSSD